LLNRKEHQRLLLYAFIEEGSPLAADHLAGEVPTHANQKVDMCRCAATARGRPRALCTFA